MRLDVTDLQPFTWKTGGLFVLTGAGLYWYFTNEKAKVQERRREYPGDT